MSGEDDEKEQSKFDKVKLDDGTKVSDQSKVSPKTPTWTVIREVGRGAFGTVYQVINEATRQEAALKIETIENGDNLLKIEREIMKIQKPDPVMIHIFDAGIFNDFRFIVMTLCGPDLEKIATMMNWKFQHETVLRICIRTLLAVKKMHEMKYVHRDLKPCNFALDYHPASLHIYLFDFGMSRKYARKLKDGWILRRPRASVRFRGSVQYCSLNTHKCKDLGRVDDVWSWLFMASEMVKPLPWDGIRNETQAEFRKEDKLKEYMSGDPFIKSTFFPIYEKLLTYDFSDRPDYLAIYSILYAKLKEIGKSLAGPMEFDAKRTEEEQKELEAKKKLNLESQPVSDTKPEDEAAVRKYLEEEFQKAVVPGGKHLLLEEGKDFFEEFGDTIEEKTDEMMKKKEKRQRSKEKKKKAVPKDILSTKVAKPKEKACKSNPGDRSVPTRHNVARVPRSFSKGSSHTASQSPLTQKTTRKETRK